MRRRADSSSGRIPLAKIIKRGIKTKNPPPGRILDHKKHPSAGMIRIRFCGSRLLASSQPGTRAPRSIFQNSIRRLKPPVKTKKLPGFFTPEVHEAITNAALGQDVFGVGWILLQFLAEIVDIKPYIMWLVPILIAPDLGKQLVVRGHPPGILHQVV